MFKIEFEVNNDSRIRTLITKRRRIPDIIKTIKREFKTDHVVIHYIKKEKWIGG